MRTPALLHLLTLASTATAFLRSPGTTLAPPRLGVWQLQAAPHRQSSSFVVEAVKAARPALVKIDLFGPRGMRSGTGTGIILDLDEGLVITNAHVAGVSRSTTITLNDGSCVEARLVGRSADCDVAVLQAADADDWAEKRGTTAAALTIGTSEDLAIGEHALALGFAGAPSDLMATAGLVASLTSRSTMMSRGGRSRRRQRQRSAGKQTEPEGEQQETEKEEKKEEEEEEGEEGDEDEDGKRVPVILTDATLSFGNSGGPLLNEWGEMVGMNTMIEMRPSAIGVAICVERVLEEVAAIRRRRDAIESSATPPATALVYLFNDPMNKRRAVEKALAEVFGWGAEKSNEVMMAAHTQGRASCGEFPAAEAAELQQALSDQDLLAEVEPVLLAGKEGGEGGPSAGH